MIFDHIGVGVLDYERAKAFYTAALAPLGITLVMEKNEEEGEEGQPGCGFGHGNKPEFWIGEGSTAPNLHVAFTAKSRMEVDAFYKAALAAGGRDNGAPGVRAHYHPNYYGAFVYDLDGHNIEAVCHTSS
jgi:catechol 2,3-dioxygenase-like lactoylglutathione lyase family enzyme